MLRATCKCISQTVLILPFYLPDEHAADAIPICILLSTNACLTSNTTGIVVTHTRTHELADMPISGQVRQQLAHVVSYYSSHCQQ